jgi:chemotaxis protein methyltransferase CheR
VTATEPSSKAAISPIDFETIRTFLVRTSGIQLEPTQGYLIDSRLSPVARQFELGGIAAIAEQLRGRPPAALASAVTDAMTTNETSFFRDQHPFDALRDEIIPDLLARRGPVDPLVIWVAASSSGQEVYTLAILLSEGFPDLVARRRIKLIATDLSPTMVARTKEGRYSQFEVNRGLPAPMLLTYFEQKGRDWVARDQLRSMITAREQNLLDPWVDIKGVDIVMMRNVLIYFSMETKLELLTRVRRTVLKPDGYLFLGASETTVNIDAGYTTERHGRAVYYRPEGA